MRLTEPGPELPEPPVQHPVVGEDQQPRVDPGQVAGPQRQQDRHVQQGAGPRRRDPRHVVGERERDDGVDHGDSGRHPDGAQHDAAVGRVPEDQREVADVPDPLDVGGEGVDPPERRDEQDRQRGQVDQHEPGQRGRQQQGGPRPRPAPERGRDAGPPPVRLPQAGRSRRRRGTCPGPSGRPPAGGRHRAAPGPCLAHRYWTTWVVQACRHWAYGTQSGLPLSHVATGVFHSEMELK